MKTRNDTESSANGKTPREIEHFEKRRPLREMIAKGKDAREATFMWIVNEILDKGIEPVNFGPRPAGVEDFDRGTMQSVLGQVRQVGAIVSMCCEPNRPGIISPKAWFYDPIFAELWRELEATESALEGVSEKLGSILDRYPKLKSMNGFKKELRKLTKKLEDLLPEGLDNARMEYAAIGFALGAHIYKRELARHLDALKLNIIEKFTIENPEVLKELDEWRRDDELKKRGGCHGEV